MHFDGARPFSLSQTIVPVTRLGYLARAYAIAGRERRAYLLIPPVSSLLLAASHCQSLAPRLQAGLVDYLALTALYSGEPSRWPRMWEAQTCGIPVQMVAELTRFVSGAGGMIADCVLRSGPGALRRAVNGYLQSEQGFSAAEECFGRGMMPQPARLSALLRGEAFADRREQFGKGL